MSELNLPDEFKRIETVVFDKNDKYKTIYINRTEAMQLLTALSEARDEIDAWMLLSGRDGEMIASLLKQIDTLKARKG